MSRAANRILLTLSLVVMFGRTLPAVAGGELNALLRDAVRYADTPEKHAVKEKAREELKQRMPDALREAMAWIHGDNVMLQVLVMEWIEQFPAETMAPVLLDCTGDARVETRRIAIFFLGFYDCPEYAARIMPFLDDEKCRGSAIRTLGKWKVDSAVPAIAQWLADGNERQRVVAANALRDTADPTAVPSLVAALDDPVFTVRNTAARALESFGDAAADALRAAPPGSARFQRMRARCLADLAGPDAERPEPEIRVDGAYFTP